MLRRRAPAAPKEKPLIRSRDVSVSPSEYRAWRGGKAINLTDLEVKVLIELIEHAGAVVTRSMLIERVWGFEFMPTTNIVDATIMRLRAKLTEHDPDDPIVTVRGVGYTLRG